MRIAVRLFLILLMISGAMAGTPAPREITAVRCHGLKIDGVLEPEWFSGGLADSFVQSRPVEGAPVTLPTRAYVLYDNEALYFGFVCNDTAPDSIAGRVQRRDNYDRSDFVNITLDTFHDRRNGYMFVVTASGVQTDAVASNEINQDAAWDGIWQSAVGRTDSGWVAEVRIPFASIRHGGARADGWGINLNRCIDRRQENSWWQPVSRERGFRMSEIGVLKGLENIGSARHAEILPHAVGRWDASYLSSAYNSVNNWRNLGADVKLVPGASWTVDLSYRPDFAQVDVDDEIINLSDYPVYVSEKRPFFLESKEIFDNAPVSLFYTRRINDPSAGAKLSLQRENVRMSVLAARDQGVYGYPDRDAAAGRAVWNLGRVSTLGFTGTYLRDAQASSTGSRFHAAAGAADARIRWRERDYCLLSLAGVDRVGNNHQPYDGRAEVYYALPMVNADYSYDYRGTDFNINDLGWDSFSNSIAQRWWFGKDYYPKTSVFQYVGYDIGYRYRTLTDNTHPETFLDYNIYATSRENIQLQIGSEFGNWYRRHYGVAGASYRDNFGLFAPEYHPVTNHWLWIASDQRKPVEAEFSTTVGTLYEGHTWIAQPSITVKARENLDFMGTMTWQHVWDLSYDTMQDLGLVKSNGNLVYDPRVWRLRARWSPTLNVSLRGTVQWREDASSVQTNLLLAWNWRSGSWFYIVYDETGRTTDPLSYSRPGDRTVRLKWTYYFTMP